MNCLRLWALSLLILLTTCNPVREVSRPEWPFRFVVVNDGDPGVVRISVDAYVFYPTENYTYITGTFRDVDNMEEDHSLMREFDSLVVHSDTTVYAGCWAQLFIRVLKRYDVDNDGQIEDVFKELRVHHDSIQSSRDNTLRVVWPKDSGLFKLRER